MYLEGVALHLAALLAEEIVGRQGVALHLAALLADKLDANLTQRRCLLDQRRRLIEEWRLKTDQRCRCRVYCVPAVDTAALRLTRTRG